MVRTLHTHSWLVGATELQCDSRYLVEYDIMKHAFRILPLSHGAKTTFFVCSHCLFAMHLFVQRSRRRYSTTGKALKIVVPLCNHDDKKKLRFRCLGTEGVCSRTRRKHRHTTSKSHQSRFRIHLPVRSSAGFTLDALSVCDNSDLSSNEPGNLLNMIMDPGAEEHVVSLADGKSLGKPVLKPAQVRLRSATGDDMGVSGSYMVRGWCDNQMVEL